MLSNHGFRSLHFLNKYMDFKFQVCTNFRLMMSEQSAGKFSETVRAQCTEYTK